MARVRSKKKAGNAGEASTQSQPEAKTPTALKPEPKIAKRSPKQNLTESKESKASPEVQGKPEQTNNDNRKKEKDIENGSAQARDQRDQNNKEQLGGMIFMCNRNTKPDCFRYGVMALPENKRETVMKIKPGLKLFLYDFDVKLLHGIYEASSAGGMKLEPAAFNGSYPAQVRFKVHVDCVPVPNDVFKKAIMGNCDPNAFFKMELTVLQVEKLVEVFRPAPLLQSNVLIAGPSPHPAPPHPVPVPFALPRPIMPAVPVPVPFALPRPIMPAVEAPLHPNPEILPRGQYAPDDVRRYYYVPVHKDTAPTQRQTISSDPLSLSGGGYRTYGLKPPGPAAPALDASHVSRDPNYPYGAVSDRYALATRRVSYPTELDHQPDLYSRRAEVTEHNLGSVAERSSAQANHLPRRGEVEYGGPADEAGRLHSAHAANALSDYNQRYQLHGSRNDPQSVPVSSRYSFAGPAPLYR